MAKVKVTVHNDALVTFLRENKPVRDLLAKQAATVKANAEASASEAENGSGGRITGYADAGFKIRWVMRGRRPRIDIVSNADSKTVTAVHFYTQKRDGVAHLRAALYGITSRGK
jgi:hypothetical protein